MPQAVWPRDPAAATITETILSLLQLPGTRPKRSIGQPRNRPCPSASRLQYVPAFLLYIWSWSGVVWNVRRAHPQRWVVGVFRLLVQ